MYQLPRLKSEKGLTHGFSSISDGNMSYLWGNEGDVFKNRGSFLERLDVNPKNCAVMSILNTDTITLVTSKTKVGIGKDSPIRTDVLVTAESGISLLLVVADCLPIIFYDPVLKILALAHCGWKSTEAKLADKVVGFLVDHYHASPADIVVGIGPGIHKESYKIVNPFQKQLAGWSDFLTDMPDGQTAIDIVGYNKFQLVSVGVKEENIEISDIDTAADPTFFSHYRSRKNGEIEGRFAAVLGMV